MTADPICVTASKGAAILTLLSPAHTFFCLADLTFFFSAFTFLLLRWFFALLPHSPVPRELSSYVHTLPKSLHSLLFLLPSLTWLLRSLPSRPANFSLVLLTSLESLTFPCRPNSHPFSSRQIFASLNLAPPHLPPRSITSPLTGRLTRLLLCSFFLCHFYSLVL